MKKRTWGAARPLIVAVVTLITALMVLSTYAATHQAHAAIPMRLSTGTYTGDGVDNRAITGVGFQADLVFIKCDCTQSGVARTSTMTGDASKLLDNTGGLQANHVQTLDADGFSVGNSAQVNGSGSTYYWTAFKAGDELKLSTYVGNGSDNRSITGIGFQPVWVATFGDGNNSIFRPATVVGDYSYTFTDGGYQQDRIQALEVDGFQIGSHATVNLSGVTYHYVAWNASANVTQSSYVGNGADNRSIAGIGFQPQDSMGKAWHDPQDGLAAAEPRRRRDVEMEQHSSGGKSHPGLRSRWLPNWYEWER